MAAWRLGQPHRANWFAFKEELDIIIRVNAAIKDALNEYHSRMMVANQLRIEKKGWFRLRCGGGVEHGGPEASTS
jgi:hypothetical protein